jgi:gliding motility associated protien GldN
MKKVTFFLIIALAFTFGIADLGAQVLTPTPYDGIYTKIHYPNRRVVPYSQLREADVMFAKRVWRKIDLREKLNQPLYYPIEETFQRKNLMKVIVDALLKEQSLNAYDALTDDFSGGALTTAEVEKLFSSTDSIQIPSLEDPEILIDTVIKKDFDPSSVKAFKIKEEWVFDKQRSVFEPRIIGICPVQQVEKGEEVFDKDMFWLYFPEVRKVLINHEVYNPYNFSQRLTYDDVFMKRQFNSLIYKVDNTYDRRLSEYTTGINALLEAEEIKTQLMDYEHNLWEQ